MKELVEDILELKNILYNSDSYWRERYVASRLLDKLLSGEGVIIDKQYKYELLQRLEYSGI